jgi:hypothetical protein
MMMLCKTRHVTKNLFEDLSIKRGDVFFQNIYHRIVDKILTNVFPQFSILGKSEI